MKKLFISFIALTMAVSLFVGCQKEATESEPFADVTGETDSFADVTIETDTIELSDGNWKLESTTTSDSMTMYQLLYITISENKTKVTVTKSIQKMTVSVSTLSEEEVERYKVMGATIAGDTLTLNFEATQEQLDEGNLYTKISDYELEKEEGDDLSIKTNKDKTKYKLNGTDTSDGETLTAVATYVKL